MVETTLKERSLSFLSLYRAASNQYFALEKISGAIRERSDILLEHKCALRKFRMLESLFRRAWDWSWCLHGKGPKLHFFCSGFCSRLTYIFMATLVSTLCIC